MMRFMTFRPLDSYIYFVQDGDDGPIKIGLAANVVRRLDQLVSATHRELVLRAVILGDARLERELHARFAADRIRGEWYHPSEAILEYVNSVPDTLRRDLKYRKRHGSKRTPLADARKIWADESLTYEQALRALAGWTQKRVTELLGPRDIDHRKGHDPKWAKKYGKLGGRPKAKRAMSREDAEKIWFDRRIETNSEALERMTGWTLPAAYRAFGKSGRPAGKRAET